jgi:2-methylcitrate dehydratase PrpD
MSDVELVAEGIRGLISWAAAVDWKDVPEAVRRRAALVLADDIAAIVAARDEPEVVKLQAGMLRSSGPPEATIFRGGRSRADRASAAVSNGAAADWCELDEGYRRAMCHAGLYTLPALLAEAEATGRTLAETLRGLVLGYEICGRFARAFRFPKLVLHPHGSLAAIGAATGVAALRRLDDATFLAAVTAASTMVVPGPFNHAVLGALVRNVWPAAGAWCGMRAVDWAECGIGGLAQSPYHVFVEGFGGEPHPTELTAGLGQDWAIAEGYQKLHACCQYAHSTVEALLAATAARQPRADDIERVLIEAHPLGMKLDNRAPATTLAAKFSIPQVAAATLVLGHAGASAFASSTLSDSAIVSLRQRVEMTPFAPEMAPPHDRPARVTVELKDGSRLAGECLSARGGPDRPFSSDEILAKIEGIAGGVYPAFTGLARRLIALDPALLARPWRDIVTEFAGAA